MKLCLLQDFNASKLAMHLNACLNASKLAMHIKRFSAGGINKVEDAF